MNIKERSYQSIAEAAKTLAEELANILIKAIATNGKAYAALSGGRTPQHVFANLRQSDIDWSKVVLTLTDERWVEPIHPESNENLVRSHLLHGPAKAATFIPMYSNCGHLTEGEAICEQNLQTIEQPFDFVYLGMGEDGHFASLFPGDHTVGVDDKMCVAVPRTNTRLARLSLTLPRILNAKKIYLLFNGEKKKEVYAKARSAKSHHEFPIQLILCQKKVPVYVLIAP